MSVVVPPFEGPPSVVNGKLTAQSLKVWRANIAADVRAAEYDLAKSRAMLAWIDAEIRKLEEAG